ncbi:hypothetical protein LSCM1_07864 [Leishmania martiniquensis]|uniref:Uncharacterized protein n=1 Tax=Leishmania martiniquensis TaxID=1580590 RepID=A0A836L0G1_9TRYP|nr:hypothetical protein LSCM1_07864 [Leishmania martiniquensis]
MPATLSADAAFPSSRALSSHAGAQGYHSLHGDFSFYPTSAHKRRAPREPSGGAVVVNDKHVAEVPQSPSTDLDGGVGTFPSFSGLSCSPSKGTPDADSLARRSSSQPLASTPHGGHVALKPASASLSFAKGGAPLLHRYRTSRADVLPRVLHRSISLPSQVSMSTPAAAGMTTRRPKNIRRSLLHTRTTAPSEPSAALAPPQGNAVAQGEVPREPHPTPLRIHSHPSHTNSSSRKRVDNPDVEVPVTRIRLVGAVPGPLSSSKGNAAAPAAPATASRQTTLPPDADDVHVKGEAHGREEKQDVGTAQLPAQTHPSSSLSRNATTVLHCHKQDCMHSEESICEFIRMQRELRRCYATIDTYEALITQLRDDCTLARAQLCQCRQEYAQHKKGIEAQVQAELTERTNALLSAPRRSEADDAPHLTPSAGPDGNVKSAAEECCVDTLQATVDELRRALKEEQSAHAESLARLTEALAAKTKWKSRAVELLQWREQVCQHMHMSSAHSSYPLGAARTSLMDTSETPPGISTTGNSATGLRAEVDAGGSASNVSSPSRRDDLPPSRPKSLSCVPSPPEIRELESSVISEVRAAPSALPHEVGTGGGLEHKENEKDNNSMRGVDGSCQSDLTAESFLSASTAPEGRAVKAVGSGVVVVWPPLEEEERSPMQSAESSAAQSSTTAAALGAGASALSADNGKREPQPSLPISPIPSSALPSNLGCCTLSGAESCVVQGCRPLSAGCERALVAAVPLLVVPDPFAFPKPPSSGGVKCTIHSGLSSADPPPTWWGVSSAMAPDSAERRCRELLRALLDKEHQLALIAEERTKYKRLYEAAPS